MDINLESQLRDIAEQMAKIDAKALGEKPIILKDADRQRIEKAIGVNVSTPEELVKRIERAFHVSVAGVEVPLTPFLLERLKSRAIRVEFDKFIQQTVKRLLEEFAGIR